MLGENEKIIREKIGKKKLPAIEQIEKRLLPGSGETDCNIYVIYSCERVTVGDMA